MHGGSHPVPPAPTAVFPAIRNHEREDSRSRTALGWMAALAAAAVIALIVALLTNGTNPVHTATSKTPPGSASHRSPGAISVPGGRGSHSPPAFSGRVGAISPASTSGTTAPPPATSSAPPAGTGTAPPASAPAAASAAGRAPVIASISPSSGTAGGTVTLTGNGFYSPSGTVVVLFGQVQAPVSCPSQQSCVVIVPPRSPATPAKEPVTIATDSGRSAPVKFTYTG